VAEKAKDAADAVRGLAEAAGLPSVVQPAAKEIGDVLGRSVRAALSPVRGLLWTLEQVEAFVFESVTEKLKNVKPDNIVEPPLTIAGPVYEALRFAAHDESLRDMYATLLATAMDVETAGTAHPSFVEIIRQLSPDEAKLLQYVAMPFNRALLTIRRGVKEPWTSWNAEWANLSGYPDTAGLVRPDLVPTYLNNASRLGLINLEYSSRLDNGSAYDHLRNTETAQKIIKYLDESEEYHPLYAEGHLTPTAFGELFFRACVFAHPLQMPDVDSDVPQPLDIE
jgi:hypothetical protein